MARSLAPSIAATLALLVCAPIAMAAQPNPATSIDRVAPVRVVPSAQVNPRANVAVDPGNVTTAAPVEVQRPQNEIALITGGNFAEPTPWQVQLYTTHVYTEADLRANEALRSMADWERIHRCGGAYIGDMWVLTAAHCVLRDEPESVFTARRVRVGTQSLTEGGTTYRIERVVIHEDYDFDTKLHDIALIRIAADANTNVGAGASLKAIRILGDKPDDPPLADQDAVTVTGWGTTGARAPDAATRGLDGSPLHSSSALMGVTLAKFPHSRCEAVPEYADFLDDTVLCIGSDVAGRDSCNGDSGGPVTREVGEERVLVGLVSWGRGCGVPGIPGIYTDVPAHVDWIAAAKRAPAGRVTRM